MKEYNITIAELRPMPEPPSGILNTITSTAQSVFTQDKTPNRIDILYQLHKRIEEDEHNNEEFDDYLYNLYCACRKSIDMSISGYSRLAVRMDETLHLARIGEDVTLSFKSHPSNIPKRSANIDKFINVFKNEILERYKQASNKVYLSSKSNTLLGGGIDYLIKHYVSSNPPNPTTAGVAYAADQANKMLFGQNPDYDSTERFYALANNHVELDILLNRILNANMVSINKAFINALDSDDVENIAQQCVFSVIAAYHSNKDTGLDPDKNQPIFAMIFGTEFKKIRETNTSSQKNTNNKSVMRGSEDSDYENTDTSSKPKKGKGADSGSFSSAKDDPHIPFFQQAVDKAEAAALDTKPPLPPSSTDSHMAIDSKPQPSFAHQSQFWKVTPEAPAEIFYSIEDDRLALSRDKIDGDGNCGITGLGTERPVFVNTLLLLANDRDARESLSDEIHQAFINEEIKPPTSEWASLLTLRTEAQTEWDAIIRGLRDIVPETQQFQGSQRKELIEWLETK